MSTFGGKADMTIAMHLFRRVGKLDQRTISPSPQSRRFGNFRVPYSAAVAIGTRGQDGLGTGCHHFATPISFAITFAAL
jgi:hypothetical protein